MILRARDSGLDNMASAQRLLSVREVGSSSVLLPICIPGTY